MFVVLVTVAVAGGVGKLAVLDQRRMRAQSHQGDRSISRMYSGSTAYGLPAAQQSRSIAPQNTLRDTPVLVRR